MGKCFSKKSKDKDCNNTIIRDQKQSRSYTPDPVCASIEIILEESPEKSIKPLNISSQAENLPSAQSAKLIINSIHRSQKPREDIQIVQTEILKATKLVEDTLKKAESTKNIHKFRGRNSDEKIRSKSWVKK